MNGRILYIAAAHQIEEKSEPEQFEAALCNAAKTQQ